MLGMSAKCTRGELVKFYSGFTVSKHEEEYDRMVL